MAPKLPPFPLIRLRIVEDTTRGSRCDEGFLTLRRRRLALDYPGGEASAVFPYDEAFRDALDAVVVVAHFAGPGGERRVYLRSALRPPAALRPRELWPVPEKPTLGQLWEVVAGLVEPAERSEQGLRRCAARELGEELGFSLPPSRLEPLGPSLFPSPAMTGERLFFFHAEVDPAARGTPGEDGSALERGAAITDVPLGDALDLCRQGDIEDMKTELGLRRLAEMLAP